MAATRITWIDGERTLLAIEPTPAEVAHHAEALAQAYNDPRNAPLLGHTADLDADDVVDHYAELTSEGARHFLLFVDGELAGDADLRGLAQGPTGVAGEFAFLIGAPTAQGKGLGTRFAQMIHAFGFAPAPSGAGLAIIYASVMPANAASLRVFDKLGYAVDDSPVAQVYADEPGDVVLAVDRATFLAQHSAALTAIKIAARDQPAAP